MDKKNSKYNPSYTQEFKDSLVKKMLAPENVSPKELALETGVSQTSLKNWLNNANPKTRNESKTKFQIVLETYVLNEAEISAYARENGLFVNEIKQWQKGCENANNTEYVPISDLKQDLEKEKKLTKKLESELKYKEKALVEAAALLVLSKKFEAIWLEKEEN